MKKVNWPQAKRKSGERIKAGVSLWERITNDPGFIKIKHKIQARYGLPLNYDIRFHQQDWRRWMGYDEKGKSQKANRGQAFLSDVYALFKKFLVPEGWYDDLIAEIAGQVISDHPPEIGRSPKFEVYKDEEGNWQWRCIITPETDLTNPMVLEMIQSQQKQYAGDPPKPTKDKTDPRQLDWRPVYEWYKRHPLFTLEEIAKKIGYPAHTVRLKIAELESKE